VIPTPTSTIAPPLITETFTLGTLDIWEAWGVTGTFTVTGDSNPAGLLIYPEGLTGGIASRETDIPLSAGLVISFSVDMDLTNYLTSTISMDLSDPELFVIWSADLPEGDSEPLPLVFYIRQDFIQITLRPAGVEPRLCEFTQEVESDNNFRFTIDRNNIPHLYLNDQEECASFNAPLPPFSSPGRLIFSGQAILDNIYVAIER
jgi:hypothetical protein